MGTILFGRDGVPLENPETLLCRSLIALLASLRFAWFSTNLRLRSSTAELSRPASAVVLSGIILLCWRLLAWICCRAASWSLLKAINLISTSACNLTGGMTRLAMSGGCGCCLRCRRRCRRWSLLHCCCCWKEFPSDDSPGKFASDASCTRLSLATAAEAITKLSWDAAAASYRIGETPVNVPQSTLQRQGGGVIWGTCSFVHTKFLGLRGVPNGKLDIPSF